MILAASFSKRTARAILSSLVPSMLLDAGTCRVQWIGSDDVERAVSALGELPVRLRLPRTGRDVLLNEPEHVLIMTNAQPPFGPSAALCLVNY